MDIWLWMKENLFWLLPPSLGAIIGYFTNWLAIKMLFRPYRRWRLWGIPIPFTPGLLPSRREEIAGKVGFVISEQLINQEELKRTLGEAHLQNELASLLSQHWIKIQKEEWTLAEVVKKTLGDQALNAILTGGNQMIPSVLFTLEHTTIKKRSIKFFSDKIENYLQNTPNVDLLNQWGAKGLQLLLENMSSWTNEDSLQLFRNQYETILSSWRESNTSLYDLIGDEYILSLKNFIRENPEIPSSILNRLLSNEDLLDRLVPFIQRIFDKHWSLSFLSALLSSERLRIMVHSLAEDGKKWLVNEEHQQQLNTYIGHWIEDFLKKPLSDLGFNSTGTFKPEQMIEWIRKFIPLLATEESMKPFEKVITSVAVRLSQKSYAEWLHLCNISSKSEDIEMQVSSYVQEWIGQSEHIEGLIVGVNLMIETFLNCSFAPFMAIWQPQEEQWLEAAKEIQNTLARTLPPGLRLLDVSKMVERKLNEFPLAELEKLTLSVAGRELKAITWFGGILGFLIGSLQLLLD
jgi:uncharacterized membrane protein YheB (UPF0754 family)